VGDSVAQWHLCYRLRGERKGRSCLGIGTCGALPLDDGVRRPGLQPLTSPPCRSLSSPKHQYYSMSVVKCKQKMGKGERLQIVWVLRQISRQDRAPLTAVRTPRLPDSIVFCALVRYYVAAVSNRGRPRAADRARSFSPDTHAPCNRART
jgi:hypothetical protein